MYAGHTVTQAANGEEAYEKAMALEKKPDLIMMDVRMPKMTGYEACRRMKGEADLKDIPVVFLSAKGQDEEIQTGIEAGAIAYILKPFAPEELNRRLAEILQQIGTA
jgi:two-component system alkaline phosphatase synthesis response regulator PhoP